MYGPSETRRSLLDGMESKLYVEFHTFEIFDRAALSWFLNASTTAWLALVGSEMPRASLPTMCAGRPGLSMFCSQSA